MSYQLNYVIHLPSGLTINAELYNADVPPNQVGPTITSDIVDNGDNSYSYLATIPDNHVGEIVFFDTAESLRNWHFAINPAEAEYILTRLPASLEGGRMSSNVSAINLSTLAAQQLAKSATTIVSGAAVSGTLSTTQMSTDLTEATSNHYNGRVLIWTSGTLKDQGAAITAYDGATKVLTFTPVTEAPLAGDTFVIL